MTPLEIVRDATLRGFVTEDGEPEQMTLLPGLSAAEGVVDGGLVDGVDFTGQFMFEYKPAFPNGLPIAADGYGNFWVVDLLPESRSYGPIYFACHDAPVILYQSRTLEHFLTELFKLCVAPHESLIDDVHEDRLFQVWRTNPRVKAHRECVESSDTELAAFAAELGPTFQIIDLRVPQIGLGFSWGRCGADTVVARHGTLPIFAYQIKERKGLWRRIFG